MAATKQDIRGWFRQGLAKGATHMVVLTDPMDHTDSPLFVMPGELPEKAVARYKKEMGDYGVMECYALHLDLESQMDEFRAQHWETAPEAKTL